MFRGIYEHTLDSKGRVAVPRRFRDGLLQRGAEAAAQRGGDREGNSEGWEGQEVMLTRGLHRCLVLYPMDRWAAFEARLTARSQFDLHVIRAKRIFVAGALECSFDAQGRILIPPLMREYAGLDLKQNVVWVGQLDTIELWDAQAWNEAYQAALVSPDTALTFDDRFAEALAQLGL